MLTRKVLKLEPLIPAVERKFDHKVATVEELQKQLENLKQQVVFVNKGIDYNIKEMKVYLEPTSNDNVEERAMLKDLAKEVIAAENHQLKVAKNIRAKAASRKALAKEVSDLRLSRRILLDKALMVDRGVAHLREELHKMGTDTPNGRVMSHILRRQAAVLKSLKALRTTQGHVQDSMGAYRAYMLKSQRLLLDRDQRRIREEVALGQLKAKLLNVYIQIKDMADRFWLFRTLGKEELTYPNQLSFALLPFD
ncbi:hypothetical protein ElyMa_000667700 [Elysia marginata]|uniref:DUF4201 domain-containing protein n=1 Tax=Elysia marginata TaxID=1093978 RepID=A0AAV4GGR3_9GAST|nr:hypothetical protein ElyMa_000667700 [Elysia marginata]